MIVYLLTVLCCLVLLGRGDEMATVVTPKNASEAILLCAIAEEFARTHMAPDFESPQLIRRLDWFHEDSLVASYQQNMVSDAAQQWWVADGRLRLLRPFYSLRIAPVKPEDSGVYRCRLDTDPLFALSLSEATVELAVLVRPSAPSSPEISSFSNRSVTLTWRHATAKAHRPILRYSVVVRVVSDNSRTVIPAPSNATSVIVDNLEPFTSYGFSVRSENAAGDSEFGPETVFRTLGEAPLHPPLLSGLVNGSAGCVQMTLHEPKELKGDLRGFRIVVQRLNDTAFHEHFFPPTSSNVYDLCHLHAHSQYALAVEVDNTFGLSPPTRAVFLTDQTVPGGPPLDVAVESMPGSPLLAVSWRPPSSHNGVIQHYTVHYRKSGSGEHWKTEKLSVRGKVSQQPVFRLDLKQLDPASKYHVRVSAATVKGEGDRSEAVTATTDYRVADAPTITLISFDCESGVRVEWQPAKEQQPLAPYHHSVQVANLSTNTLYNTTVHKIDISGLSLHDEYHVRVASHLLSLVDRKTLIKGSWSAEQRFILADQCALHASVCGDQVTKCEKLTQASRTTHFGVLIALCALVLFILVSALVIYSLKGSCIDVKAMLKQKKEKCVYLEELSPLVYDATGCEAIPVELFYGYCEDLMRNDNTKFKQQFEMIECSTADNPDYGQDSDIRVAKNRYLNIGAREETRIRLVSSPTGSDYINANYIDSCEKRHAYIATQAPLPNTFTDFWSMVWQERCNVIVMITQMVEDGRRKCDQYWPSVGAAHETHGVYQVGVISETVNAHYIHRIFSLKLAKCVPPTERRVHQLHFVGWPDHGVPPSVFPLLSFMNAVADIHSTGPVVVHCSAGVGRSGSYILVDAMRRHLIAFRSLNITGHLVHMRRQRDRLVQTVDQYIFCHEAVRQLIRHGITRVHSDLFHRYIQYLSEENVNGKTRMQMQFEDICRCAHTPCCQAVAGEAVILPGFHRLDEFVVGGWREECEALWMTVWHSNVQTVVLIGDECYWTGLEKAGSISLQRGDNVVLLQQGEEQLCVRMITVSLSAFLSDSWGEIERVQTERLAPHDSPLLVLCPTAIPPRHSPLTPQPHPVPSPTVPSLPNGTVPLSSFDPSPSTTPPYHSVVGSLSRLNRSRRGSRFESLPVGVSPGIVLCALTALACQLETQGCVDVVQLLSSYTHARCGLWSDRQEVEFIYDRLLQLIHVTKV